MGFEIIVDYPLELDNLWAHATTDALSGNIGEEAFDLVEPGRPGWRELHVEAGIPGQPALDFWAPVSGGVAGDQIDIEAWHGLSVVPGEKAEHTHKSAQIRR